MADLVLTHAHLFGGDGGGAVGFNQAHIRLADLHLEARFRCLGSIDGDPSACRDFERFVGVPATCRDLFDRGQFVDFHAECAEPGADRCAACGNTGHPPDGWREVVADDVRAAFQNERPDIVFTSAPCTGFSGLLNTGRSKTRRYQALNRLTVRGIRLLLEAFESEPVPLILFENVPLIQTRGRALLDDIRHELEMAGYAVAETVHDCGEIGGLAQNRKRLLLVARHRESVRPFVYMPPKLRVRGVGEVIGELPMPGDPRGGAMHTLANITNKTALRLALIPAGKDWRALEGMDFGALRIVPREHGCGPYGVTPWAEPVATVAGRSGPTNGAYSVADARMGAYGEHSGKMRVEAWDAPAHTVTGSDRVGSGAMSVADVRMESDFAYGVYRVLRWDEPAKAVSSCSEPGSGGYTVADVRADGVRHNNVFRVVRWGDPAQAVTAGAGPSSGGQAVADMRVSFKRPGGAYDSQGNLGVVDWRAPAGAVTSSACHDNGRWNVADPRDLDLNAKSGMVILSLDGTWHRPFTTLELATIQGYDPADLMDAPLVGESHTEWRRHVGNRVPPPAARACAMVFGEALIRHRAGEGWRLDTRAIWVRRLVAAVAVPT